MVVVARLRGPTRYPERRFLAHAGTALGFPIDFARIQVIHHGLDGAWPAS